MYDVDIGICMYLLFVARGLFKLGTYLHDSLIIIQNGSNVKLSLPFQKYYCGSEYLCEVRYP